MTLTDPKLRCECVFVSVIMVMCARASCLVHGSLGAGLLTGLRWGLPSSYLLPGSVEPQLLPPACPGFEHSESRVRVWFYYGGCHSIFCSPFGGSLESGKGPTPIPLKARENSVLLQSVTLRKRIIHRYIPQGYK